MTHKRLDLSCTYVSIFEGPPPLNTYVVYVASEPVTKDDFTFSFLGLFESERPSSFTSRSEAESFVHANFPDVPLNFVSWPSICMLSAISFGEV